LVDTYGVTLQPTDGESLASTPSASIDLVHAHKVFVSTSFLVTLRYFDEMARVTRPGGRVLFDVMTEDCVDDATTNKWLAVDFDAGFYPAIVPRRTVVDFFHERGLRLVGSRRGSMAPGFNEVFLFER
jgi:SAM-dependent methyltransferase